MCVDLEVCQGGQRRGGGRLRLVTGDAVPADCEAGEAGAESPDDAQVDLAAVTAVAEEAELPQLAASHLQHGRDELQTDASHRQAAQPAEVGQVTEALKLPGVDVVDDQLVQVGEYHGDQLCDARLPLGVFPDAEFERAQLVVTPCVSGLKSLCNDLNRYYLGLIMCYQPSIEDSLKNSCILSRNFSIREESTVTRRGKFSRRQRTALLEMLVPSR